MKRMLVLASLLFGPLCSMAQGFDDTYQAYYGDLNSDGRSDLYLKGRTSAFVPIIVDDINILVVRVVPKDFVLTQNASHSSTIVSELTAPQRAAVAQWPQANVSLSVKDFNLDGAADVLITGLTAATGALDQIVFASTVRGLNAPLTNNSIDDDVRLFFKTVHDWMLNPSTLTRNQYKVVGTEPASKTWVAFFVTNDPSPSAVSVGLSLCPPGRVCALSNTKPLDDCNKVVDRYDENGNYLGTGPEDVCPYSLHVWSYTPGSITLAQNASFHQDAVTFVDSFDNLVNGNITSYGQITSSLSLLNSYLGITAPIGSSAQQCEDAPAVSQMGFTGLGPLAVPAGYVVYYCALAAVVVATAATDLIRDVLDVIKETTIYTQGNATEPAPYSGPEEDEALNFKPDPFGDDCDPPRGNGSLRTHIIVLNARIAWRYTDLNPDNPAVYASHVTRIKILERARDKLRERYRNICGGEPP